MRRRTKLLVLLALFAFGLALGSSARAHQPSPGALPDAAPTLNHGPTSAPTLDPTALVPVQPRVHQANLTCPNMWAYRLMVASEVGGDVASCVIQFFTREEATPPSPEEFPPSAQVLDAVSPGASPEVTPAAAPSAYQSAGLFGLGGAPLP